MVPLKVSSNSSSNTQTPTQRAIELAISVAEETAAAVAAAAANEDSSSRANTKYYYWKFGQTTSAAIIFFMIVIGNVSILNRLKRCRRRRSNVNYFIIQLAIADLFVGVFSLALDSFLRLQKSFPYGLIACQASKYISNLFIYSSTFLLVALSIDRWEAVVRPLAFTKNRNHGFYLVLGAWLLALVCAVPVTVNTVIRPVEGLNQCYIQLSRTGWKVYMVYLTSSLLVVPAIIIAICYAHIVYTIWRRGQSVIVQTQGCSSSSRAEGRRQQQQQRRRLQASESRAAASVKASSPSIDGPEDSEDLARQDECNLSTTTTTTTATTTDSEELLDDTEDDFGSHSGTTYDQTMDRQHEPQPTPDGRDGDGDGDGDGDQQTSRRYIIEASDSRLRISCSSRAAAAAAAAATATIGSVSPDLRKKQHKYSEQSKQRSSGKRTTPHKRTHKQHHHQQQETKQEFAKDLSNSSRNGPDGCRKTKKGPHPRAKSPPLPPSESRQRVSGKSVVGGVAAKQQQQQANQGVIPKARIKTIKMTLVIVVAFVLSWLPFCIINLCGVFGLMRSDTAFAIALQTLTQSLAHLNSAINPIIYWIFSSKRSSSSSGGAGGGSKITTNATTNNNKNNNKSATTTSRADRIHSLSSSVSRQDTAANKVVSWRNNVKRIFCWSHFCGLSASDCLSRSSHWPASQQRRCCCYLPWPRLGRNNEQQLDECRLGGAGQDGCSMAQIEQTIGVVLLPITARATTARSAAMIGPGHVEEGSHSNELQPQPQQQQQQQNTDQISRILIQ